MFNVVDSQVKEMLCRSLLQPTPEPASSPEPVPPPKTKAEAGNDCFSLIFTVLIDIFVCFHIQNISDIMQYTYVYHVLSQFVFYSLKRLYCNR